MIAVVALLAIGGFVAWSRSRRENGFFSGIGHLIGNAGEAIAGAGKEFGSATAQAYSSPGTSPSPPTPAPPPPYVPTFSGRQFDKMDWSCPWWTVESGSTDDSKACYKQPYVGLAWKWDGTKWGWACPNGTVPNNDSQWEKKCVVGYTGRVYTDNGWVCPGGTTDTGKNWGNSDWYGAQQQCQRSGPYTTRIPVNKKWVCPPGSKDTGISWGNKDPNDPEREWKQCKWTGP